jgi:hypothetical protein
LIFLFLTIKGGAKVAKLVIFGMVALAITAAVVVFALVVSHICMKEIKEGEKSDVQHSIIDSQ